MKNLLNPLLLALTLTISAAHAASDDEIRTTLANAGLTAPIVSITPSPIPSLTLIHLSDGNEPLLLTDDLKYIILGNIEKNPSPTLAIGSQISTAKAGTPIDGLHKTALLTNLKSLKNIDAKTDFYHTNVSGVLWSMSKNGTPFLLSADGQYFINGEISVIKNGQFAGLDTDFEHSKNRHVLSQLDDDTLTIYPAKGQQKSTIYVATDINCPYCKIFHNKINELNNKGITVKAIGYPIYDESHAPMRKIWCQKDNAKRIALLSAAMKGIRATMPACPNDDNPIAHNQKLAHSLAIFATPAIFNDKGEPFQGDLSGDELLEFLNIK